MDYGRKKVRLGDVLVNSGLVTQEQIEQVLQTKVPGKRLGELLVEKGLVTEDDIAKALSEQLGMDLVDLMSIIIAPEVLNLIKPDVLKKDKIFPVEFAEGNANVLRVAMADPMDIYAQDDISIITNCQVEPLVTTNGST